LKARQSPTGLEMLAQFERINTFEANNNVMSRPIVLRPAADQPRPGSAEPGRGQDDDDGTLRA
jgi:hypothetical protein